MRLNGDEERPDPDSLLRRIQAESRAPGQGSLKIFFGYAAGVGKTYTMLKAAQAQAAADVLVAAGYVQTHGRAETDALLEGLDILPRKEVPYRGITLSEFDIDVALLIRPELILVDELAHTNAPGMRHAKRWQDVEELLANGINVYTTLNVQHIESLNNIISQITGVKVAETVPDTILERADQIELIDIPPDDLLQRFREGKVYIPAQAERAMQNFFQKNNLIALREIALRRTAERVGDDTETARLAHGAKGPWATVEKLLVCIGPSPTSSKVIRTAKRLSAALKAEWIGVFVETPATANMGPKARRRMEQNIKLAENLGGEVIVLHGDDVARQVVDYGVSRNVTKIVIGKNIGPSWLRRFKPTIVDELLGISGDIDVYVIRGVEKEEQEEKRPQNKTFDWRPYAGSSAIMALSLIVASALFGFGLAQANVAMIILLGVIVSAVRYGKLPGVIMSVIGVLVFDFFFVTPYYSFAVSDIQYVITFAVMLFVALVTSGLTSRIRNQNLFIQKRELRAGALLRLNTKLSTLAGMEDIIKESLFQISDVFDGEAAIFIPDESGRIAPQQAVSPGFADAPKERAVAHWVYRNRQPAGMGTSTLPEATAQYVPLMGLQGVLGVIGFQPRNPENLLDPDFKHLFLNFTSQVAMAIERDILSQKTRELQVQAETEKMRSALLSSVSHDLRTPLTGIAGASESLVAEYASYDDDTKIRLLMTINDESKRLVKFVENLLYMTRLESDAITVKKEWAPVEEVIGSALGRMKKQLAGHPVHTSLPMETMMGFFDGALIEQVLMNLLENAAKYTKAGAQIDVSASMENGEVVISVGDRGDGLPQKDIERIFEKFFRGRRGVETRDQPGAGLGLAICKSIVNIHGGRIWAENRPGGGARFCFTIPPGSSPPPALDGNELE